MSNLKLSSRYPDVNYVHGNTQADRLADKGKAEPKKDFIPEGMEDFIVTELGNQIPLSIADV